MRQWCGAGCADAYRCRRIADQRVEQETLAGQHAELQQSLAFSHAAHLALQHHHQAQMEAWRAERQDMEQQHKQQLEALQQVRGLMGSVAGALTVLRLVVQQQSAFRVQQQSVAAQVHQQRR